MVRVALTFDDGPHPRWTREIVDALARRPGVQATFFIWGEQALQHGDVVAELVQAGHSVQPHCWEHRVHPDLSPSQIRGDLERVTAVLKKLGAPPPRLWRPPWGQLRKGTTRRVARGRGLELVGWNTDSHDWDGRSGGQMYTSVRAQMAELPAAVRVVLLHDSYVEPRQAAYRSDCAETLDLVKRLIDDEELTFTPLLHGVAENLYEQRGRTLDRSLRKLSPPRGTSNP